MDYISIGHSKIKIILSADDMKHYRISADETANNSPDIRTSIREILRDIGKDDEYNLNGDRLLLQLYTSKDGGGELICCPVRNRRRSFP